MKYIKLLIALTCVTTLYSQNLKESDVPSAVKIKFSSMYPAVSGVKWEKENGKYEAEFKEKGDETSVIFESNGAYILTETEIPVTSLPPGVNDYVTVKLGGRKITEACMITNADGTISYKAEAGKGNYLFDSNGNFIGKETDNKDTEDDNN